MEEEFLRGRGRAGRMNREEEAQHSEMPHLLQPSPPATGGPLLSSACAPA